MPIEYEKRLLKNQAIDRLTNNTVERLKVSSIEHCLITECIKLILEMPILVTYLVMVMKVLSLDNEHIVKMMILYKC